MDKKFKYKKHIIYVEDTSGKKQDNSENDIKIIFLNGDFDDLGSNINLSEIPDYVESAKEKIDHLIKNPKQIKKELTNELNYSASISILEKIVNNAQFLIKRLKEGKGY